MDSDSPLAQYTIDELYRECLAAGDDEISRERWQKSLLHAAVAAAVNLEAYTEE